MSETHAKELPSDEAVASREESKSTIDVLWFNAIGSNLQYYIEQFRPLPLTRHNWAAFFLLPVWFAYRKLYGMAAALAIFFIGLYAIAAALATTVTTADEAFLLVGLCIVAELLVRFWIGANANDFLYKRLEKIVKFATQDSFSASDATAYAKREGGVSWLSVLIFLLLYFIVGGAVMLGVSAIMAI